MAQPIHVQALKIVGYADSLTREMLPTIVPPVFVTQSEPLLAVLPPFTIHEGLVYGAACVPVAELNDLAAQDRITLFATQFDAQIDFLLWIDGDNRPHYAHRSEVTSTLSTFAAGKTAEAERALARRDWTTAEACCNAAISASESLVEPFAIQAAIRRIQLKESEVAVMARMAQHRLTPSGFEALLAHYCNIANRAAALAPDRAPARPMNNVALIRPLAA